MIFSKDLSRKVFDYLSQMNLSMNYYDPDSDYKDDYMAFMDAFEEKMDRLNTINRSVLRI